MGHRREEETLRLGRRAFGLELRLVLAREDLLVVHFVALVLDDEHVKKTAADKAADRVDRKEGVADLDQDRGRHRDAEGEDHLVAPADRALRAQQREERHPGAERIERDLQRERDLSQRAGRVLAPRVDGEETVGESVRDQRGDEERQQTATHPQQRRAHAAVQPQVGDDEARPCVDGHRHREEEEERIDVEDSTPLPFRNDAPQDIRHEKAQQADQKTPELKNPRTRLDVPPIDQLAPVDDQMDD